MDGRRHDAPVLKFRSTNLHQQPITDYYFKASCQHGGLNFISPLLLFGHVDPISTMKAGIAFVLRVREESVDRRIMSAHLCNLAMRESARRTVAVQLGSEMENNWTPKSLCPALQGVGQRRL